MSETIAPQRFHEVGSFTQEPETFKP